MPETGKPTPNGSTTARERLAAAQAAEQRDARRRRLGLVAGGVAAVVALAGGVTYTATRSGDSPSASSSGEASSGSSPKEQTVDGISGMKVWNDLGRDHVDGDPTFAMTPPVGGNHNVAWANCGVYDKKIPDKFAVHSLEHGAVWITYTDKVSSGDLATLKKVAGQDYMLMSPYPGQNAPIVVSAWEHQITATNASDPRIQKFVSAYLQGPQTPEPGAACSGAYDPNTGKLAGSM